MNGISTFEDARLFAPPPEQQPQGELGQSDFLELMITQFRNQDPFEPMDNGQFLGQLAQFSTVNGIASLNAGFAGLSASLQSEQALQAANLVGRTVLASSDVGYLAENGTIDGAVELGTSASNVQIDITDSSGQLIKTINLGEQEAGMARFSWDGTNADGDFAGSDHYLITARVLRGDEVESAETLIEANVESVTLGRFGQGMTLNLPGGGLLPLSLVRQIT